MTDLSALSADELAEKVETVPDGYPNQGQPALWADQIAALGELRDRASERDQAVRQRDNLSRIAHKWSKTNRRNVARVEELLAERDQAVRERDDWKRTASLAAAAELKHEQRADRLAAALERRRDEATAEMKNATGEGYTYWQGREHACQDVLDDALAASQETSWS